MSRHCTRNSELIRARHTQEEKEEWRSTAAVRSHGEKGSTSTAQSDWLAAVRMVVAPPPHFACVCLPWTERMMRRKRDAVRSSSISVNCDTSHAIPSDYLQPRPSPSAAVGAFSLHRAPSRASSPTNTTGKQQPHATPSTEYKRRIHLHCNVCVLRVWLCVPTATQKGKKTEKKTKYLKRRTNTNAQQRRMPKERRMEGLLKLRIALQPDQRQTTEDLFKTKENFP
ncbi:hypothetical protein TcCL_Unassigned04664 [Trypanosoma cruzi]|nr:hypothetical protein TcCL_Unassigned04664 [Trypanosoma cruzi]